MAGALIRKARKKLRYTLDDVAKYVGVSANYISELERGIKNNPTDEVIEKIAEFLHIDATELYALFGKVPPSIMEEFSFNPSIAKGIDEINKLGLSEEEKRELYDRIGYWTRKIMEEYKQRKKM